ncbi:lysostaphin resistance A-like protein [Saccharicrinis sp. FJH62]|uniref:CPBP family intramembrane glutamic endopeptidase n=1 Tax=Saccharicrinis sp. FJH62 TaxID=3344657 RepID=UPI0035D4E883
MFLDQIKKGNRAFVAYLPAVMLIILSYFIGQFILSIVLGGVAMLNGGELTEDVLKSMDFSRMGISNNVGFLIIMSSFLVPFFGLFFAKIFHRRPMLTFVTAREKLDFKRIGFAILIWGIILGGSTLADYFMDPDNYEITFEAKSFIWLFLIALIFFPFQVSFEEIFFRGYLYQLLGNIFKYPVIAWILTSVLFGLMHSANPEVYEYGFWKMMPGYVLLGAFLGLITILDDGLEMAIGIHFINNFFLAVGVNYTGSALKTDSAFQVLTIDPTSQWYGILISGSIFMVVAWLFYRFNGFKKLIQPVRISKTTLTEDSF